MWLGLPAGGHRRDFILGCPLAAAALSCEVQPDKWVAPHLARVRTRSEVQTVW